MSNFNYQLDEKNTFLNVYDKLTQAYAELEALTNSIPGGVAKILIDGKNTEIKYASEGFYSLTGYTQEEYECLDIHNNSVRAIFRENIPNLIKSINGQKNKENPYIEYKIHKKDGSAAWIMAQGNVISCVNGISTAMCIFTDITSSKTAQEQLEMERERYRIVADISDDYLFEYINESDTMIYSEKYKVHFGIDTVVNNYKDSIEKRGIIPEEDWNIFLDIYNNLKQGKSLFTAKYRVRERTGELSWYSICFTTIFGENNIPIKSVGKITNIDELKKENEKLREKSQRDSLTKLSNKMTTQSLIQKYLETDSDSHHALMMIDIDNFKSINDTFGHITGDNVLTELSSRLKKVFRSTDVIGRVGGDEFLVMLRGIQSDSLIDEKAEAICNIFRSINIGDCDEFSLTGSVGIATFPQDGRTFDELVKKADEAVYRAKRYGKDCYERYC